MGLTRWGDFARTESSGQRGNTRCGHSHRGLVVPNSKSSGAPPLPVRAGASWPEVLLNEPVVAAASGREAHAVAVRQNHERDSRRPRPHETVVDNGAYSTGFFRRLRRRCTGNASVAQLDRAPGFEPGGRGFESLRARHSHFSPRLKAGTDTRHWSRRIARKFFVPF